MKTKIILILAWFLIVNIGTEAQNISDEWTVKNLNDENFSGHYSNVTVHSDGYIYVAGNYWGEEKSQILISKYDSSGVVIWKKYYANYPQRSCHFKQMIIEENYIYILASIDEDFLTLRYSTNGLLLFDVVYNAPDSLNNAPVSILVKYNEVYVIGNIEDADALTNYTDAIIVKYDSNGFQKWATIYGNQWNGTDFINNLFVDNEKNVYVSISGKVSANTYGFITNKYNSIGQLSWSNAFEYPDSNIINVFNKSFINLGNNDNVYVLGGGSYNNSVSGNHFLTVKLKYNNSGNLLLANVDTTTSISNFTIDSANIIHRQYFSINNSNNPEKTMISVQYDSLWNEIYHKEWSTSSFGGKGAITSFEIDNKSNLYCSGYLYYKEDSINYGTYFITEKIDSNNQRVWISVKNWEYGYNIATSITLDSKNNVYVIAYGGGIEYNQYLIKYCGYCNSTIKGSVYFDENENCIKDSTEVGIPNVIIKTEPEIRYATTDSLGNYTLFVDTGTYNIKQVLPNEYWSESCPENQQYYVHITPENDAVTDILFANKANILCPLLNVSISTPRLRRCFSNNQYYVSYSNTGLVLSEETYIKINLDEYVNPLSSTLPWTNVENNTYTFDVGTLNQNQTGQFIITSNVSCDAMLGQTLCTEARIFPDSLCVEVDSIWDKSSITVTGECTGDSLVCFVVKNNGESMTGISYIRVFYDNYLIDSLTFQLSAGDSLIKCYEANGQTIRLEADQRPEHPGNSHPQATVELCGNSLSPSLGFVTIVANDDASPNIDIDCHEIIGSYDPNEKTVSPKGLTNEKYIPQNTQLQYKIDFQNTGTDTAFTVIILDTISPYLDIESVAFGVTSHNSTCRIYGDRIIEWRFDNILLPDSNTNEPESHGFVTYNINQIQNLEKGTVLENNAGIYFDFNLPIITNTTRNIVCDTLLINSIPVIDVTNKKTVLIFPNPSTGQITIKAKEPIETIEIYNCLGIKTEEIKLHNKELKYTYRSKNVKGIYFVKVKTKANVFVEKVLFK